MSETTPEATSSPEAFGSSEAAGVPRRRPLLVVSLEGFTPLALGCYGSSWNSTPAIDRIAANGAVWDRVIASSLSPQEVFRSWVGPAARGEWQREFRRFGSVDLLTDDPTLPPSSAGHAFDRVILVDEPVESATELAAPAADIEETQFGRLIAAALDRHAEEEDWSVLWLHSRFLTHRWDAPRELAGWESWDDDDRGRDEESEAESTADEPAEERLPPIFTETKPPHIQLGDDAHPDLVTSWMRTYGCQVRLVDLMLGLLLESLQSADPIVVVLGTSGFCLGENGWIGHRRGPVRSCQLRLPRLIGHGSPLRSTRLTSSDQLPDILRCLSEPSPVLIPATAWVERDRELDPAIITRVGEDALSQQPQSIAVTTPRWFLCRDGDSEALFLKPDDAHDVNDVSRLEREKAEQLREMLESNEKTSSQADSRRGHE